jgi:hypothetical protein
MVAGFLATTNAGRVALACRGERPAPRTLALALMAGIVLIVAGVVFADDLLDALAISPESFRIAAGLVLGAAGLRTIVWPQPSGPFAAILVTPGLACLAVSFGADEATGKVLGAAAISLAVVAIAATARPREPAAGLAAQFLSALQVVVAVALVISGIRDV